MKKLYFVTGNENKLREAQKILGDVEGLKSDLPEIQDMDSQKIIEAKLKEAMKIHPNVFAEDVSFELECMKGFPGPLIKWMLQSVGRRGIYDICRLHDNYNVTARAVIGLSLKGKITYFEGEIKGKVCPPKGESGFGWDPIFMPEGFTKSFAEMTETEKNKISHRRKALEKMKEFLNDK